MILCLILAGFNVSAQNTGGVTGLESGYSFRAENCGDAGKSLSFSLSGKTFRLITLYFDGSAVSVAENAAGARTVLFSRGRPAVSGLSGGEPDRIGFSGDIESKANEYCVGVHDFTGDSQPEIVIGVRANAGAGFAVYVFQYAGNSWKCIGNMTAKRHAIRSCRVFRQTVTMKDADSGVLYTWTYHGGTFDFLSSDNANDPSAL